MAINLRNTNDVSVNGVKVLVYGQAGAGKTHLIRTLPHPVILSAEGGLLSLQGTGIPYVEISNLATLTEEYKWLANSNETEEFQ